MIRFVSVEKVAYGRYRDLIVRLLSSCTDFQ